VTVNDDARPRQLGGAFLLLLATLHGHLCRNCRCHAPIQIKIGCCLVPLGPL
jgi:hypothetical protein